MTIKSIRNIEASVQPSRDRKQKITDQIAQLKYKEPNSPKIVVLEQELVRAEAESLVAEAQLSNITREKIKAAYTYQFDALREHCEKVADFVSKDLFEDLIKDEEGHINFLETQLGLFDKLGAEKYGQLNAKPASQAEA